MIKSRFIPTINVSPLTKKNLNSKKVNNIIKQRTKLVQLVLSNKTNKKQIIDRARIKIILKNIKRKSKAKKIDTKLTNVIWSNMIKAYIDFEYRKSLP